MFFKKYGIHLALIIASAFIILVPYLKDEPDPEKINRATVAAMDFLEIVDQGDYEAARKESATLLKGRVTLDDWIEYLSKLHNTLGPVLDRKLETASYSTTAKDSPDGEYVILTFTSQFKRKVGITETIVVMVDKNRGWRVAAYVPVIKA